MKKIVYFAALMMIATVAITSCVKPANSIKAGTIYRFSADGDLFDLCDFIVSYRGHDGTIKTDTITKGYKLWEKQIIQYTTSFNEYFAYHIQLKPDVQLTQDEYDAYLYYEVRTEWPDYPKHGAMKSDSHIVPRDHIVSFIDSLNRLGNPAISIDVNNHQLTVVKGNKEDIECFEMNNYGESTDRNAVDSATVAEQEPATQRSTSAQ